MCRTKMLLKPTQHAEILSLLHFVKDLVKWKGSGDRERRKERGRASERERERNKNERKRRRRRKERERCRKTGCVGEKEQKEW